MSNNSFNEGILTYKEAKIHINQVKTLLKSAGQLEYYIKHTEEKLKSLYRLADEVGKEGAILCYKKVKKNYDSEYDKYCNNLEVNLRRVRFQVKQVMEALENVPNDAIKDILKYYYVEDHTIEDAADYFGYSVSSISRYKKLGLIKMTEMLFGIIISDSLDIQLKNPEDVILDKGLLDY